MRVDELSYEILQRKERYLSVINDFALSLIQQNTTEKIVWAVAKHAIARLGFVDCVVYLMNESECYLVQKAAHGPKNPIALDILNPIVIEVGDGIVGNVALTGLPEIISNTSQDPRYILDDEMRLSEIAVPIIADSKVIGVIDSEHPEQGFFTQDHLEILTTIASMTATKLQQAVATEKLKKSNQELEQFACIASHDLQQPLRIISCFSALLEKKFQPILGKEGSEYLEFIRGSALQMNELIQNLLNYSKLSYSTKNLQKVPCELVMLQVCQNLSVAIEETQATINYGKLPTIKAELAHLIQLFQNLIGNAIKFRSTVPPHIQISVRTHATHHHFTIQDNGIGISADQQDRIFNIFTKGETPPTGESSTGIGLAICKKTVENLGGKIWVESEVGVGSRFHFTICNRR